MEGSFSLIPQGSSGEYDASQELSQPEGRELSLHILAPQGDVNFTFSVPTGRMAQ